MLIGASRWSGWSAPVQQLFASLVLVLAGAPVPAARPQAGDPPPRPRFVTLVPQLRSRITNELIGPTGVRQMAVSISGLLAVQSGADQVAIFDSTGHLLRAITTHSRDGMDAVSLAWMGDTLMVLDRSARSATLFSTSTEQPIKSITWPGIALTGALLTEGRKLFVTYPVLLANEFVTSPLGARTPRSQWMMAEARLNGVGPGSLIPDDPAGAGISADCLDRRGNIQILPGMEFGQGPMRAMTPSLELIVAERDSFHINFYRPGAAQATRSIKLPEPRIVGSPAYWDSTAATLAGVDRTTLMRCDPPRALAGARPAINAIRPDGQGRLWVESPLNDATTIRIFSENLALFGAFKVPPHDARVNWVVRGNSLFVASTVLGRAGIDMYDVHPD